MDISILLCYLVMINNLENTRAEQKKGKLPQILHLPKERKKKEIKKSLNGDFLF